jgi:hypothetical protein
MRARVVRTALMLDAGPTRLGPTGGHIDVRPWKPVNGGQPRIHVYVVLCLGQQCSDWTLGLTESRTELKAESSCSILSFSAESSANEVGWVPLTPFVRAAERAEGVWISWSILLQQWLEYTLPSSLGSNEAVEAVERGWKLTD